jgi:hypothetical protein
MAHLVSLGKGKHQAESSGRKQPKKKFKPTKNKIIILTKIMVRIMLRVIMTLTT